jgi:hypothetical protein
LEAKNTLLGVFLALVVVLASATLIEHGQVTTVTATSTITQTSTTVSTAMTTTTDTVRVSNSADSWLYLDTSGVCSSFSATGSGYTACWGGSGNGAYVFNCASAAATPQGCTRQVTTTLTTTSGFIPSYIINVWYPFANETEPAWANCLYSVQTSGQPLEGFANCAFTNSTAFTMGIPAPPPM